MKRFVDLKISAKLVVGFLVISLIGTVIGIVGLVGLSKLWKEDKHMYVENTQALENAGSASTTFVLIRYNTYKLSVLKETTKLKDVADNNTVLIKQLEGYMSKCAGALETEEFQVMLDKIVVQWEDKYKPDMEKLTLLALNGDTEGATALVPGLAALGTEMFEEFVSFLAVLSEDAAGKAAGNETLAITGIIAIITIMVVGLFVSMILALRIARNITIPLNKTVGIADKLAVGDLDDGVKLDCSRKDEIGQLSKSFEQLLISTKKQVEAAKRVAEGDLTVKIDLRSDKDRLGQGLLELIKGLKDLVSSIYAASEQVTDGSNMLSNSSMALSQGATEQAGAVQELSATIQEIAEQTTINAKNAEEASELGNSSKVYAEQGNAQMKAMLKAMDEISESSKNISRVIKVIDDIAFQTNILALNAAVEAARAGAQGKGFAVVAEEVRSLAAKSANAAKETTEMIENSIQKVEAGIQIADQTAESLNLIVGQIQKAAELNHAIAHASQEQAIGIAQLNQGIAQVSQVVQTNAATSEESAAASQELSSQAEQLKEIVSVFKLDKVQPVSNKMHVIDLGTQRLLQNKTPVSHRPVYDTQFGKY